MSDKSHLLPITFRLHTKEDVGFCAKSFILNARQAPGMAPQLGDVIWPRLQFLFEALWVAPKMAWIVACDAQHPSYIHGYLVGERVGTVGGGDELVVHFIYVRRVSRRFGVARRLLERFDTRPNKKKPIRYSLVTPVAREILRKRVGWGLFDPWYLWEHVAASVERAAAPGMTKLRREVTKATDARNETPTQQALGYIDPNPELGAPVDDPSFADTFNKMAREAGRKGGIV